MKCFFTKSGMAFISSAPKFAICFNLKQTVFCMNPNRFKRKVKDSRLQHISKKYQPNMINHLRYLPDEVIGLRSGGDRCGSAWCAGCGAGAGGGCGEEAGDVGLSRLPSAFTGASPAFCWARRSCLRNFARRFWNHT